MGDLKMLGKVCLILSIFILLIFPTYVPFIDLLGLGSDTSTNELIFFIALFIGIPIGAFLVFILKIFGGKKS